MSKTIIIKEVTLMRTRKVFLLFFLMILLAMTGCIKSYTPEVKEITLTGPGSVGFSVTTKPANCSVTWTLDGAVVATGQSYVFTADDTSIGDHTLTATDAMKAKVTWTLHVKQPIQDWTMFQGNAKHTGYVPVTLDPANFTTEWNVKISTNGKLNPLAASDGKVFVTESGTYKKLHVLDSTTGSALWELDFGKVHSLSSPSIDNGVVYVQTGLGEGSSITDAYLRAYDITTGDFIFRSIIKTQWEDFYAPTIYENNIYTNGGYYGGCYAFGPDGVQLWWITLNQYDKWAPAVDENYVYAYTGDYDPKLSVIDRITGLVSYEIDDPNFDWDGWSMNLAPILGTKNNIIAIHDGRLISFDLINKKIGYEISSSFTGQPAVANGVIYCINAGALEARDESTGSKLWAMEAPDTNIFQGSILATNGHVFVSTASNTYAVSINTHKAVWTFTGANTPAWSDGHLYLMTSDYKVISISAYGN
jgi:hypothetical protein